jgi:hypothetical protein
MSVPISMSFAASLDRPLDSALIGSRLEEERHPAALPAPIPVPVQVPVHQAEPLETQSGPDFKEIVRANLQAAAQHAMLGHEGPSFRECSRPSCRNASNLIPYPVVVEATVTEADMEEIFQRIVPAAMEEAASNSSAIRTAPEWQDDQAFIA